MSEPVCSDSNVQYRLASPEDDAEMLAALRENPMDSWVSLAMEREPSFFGLGEEPGRLIPIVARKKTPANELAGVCDCRIMPIHLGGERVNACYLGGLRLPAKYRGRVGVLRGGFRAIPRLIPEARTSPLQFTSIASGNLRARRILETGVKGMPRYSFLGPMETFAVSVSRGRKYGLLEHAQAGDVDELARFYNTTSADIQLSPVLDPEWLNRRTVAGKPMFDNFLVYRSEGRIKACLAVWDQRAYKQIVVQGYRRPVQMLRPLYNLGARWAGKLQLPPVGGRVEQVFLAFRACDPTVADMAAMIIREALCEAKAQSADAAFLGISPLAADYAKIKREFSPWIYETRILSVKMAGCLPPPQVEGFVQPEVALL